MVSLARHIAAVVAILALGAGNVAVCAGWQTTAEARMACCMSSTTCPMQKSEDHDHASIGGVSQTQADSCCAISSQRRESSSAGSSFAVTGVITLVPVAVFAVPTTVVSPQEWRALVPLRVSSVPKHLLLSVLIV
jgi:hypothetical protein